LSSPFSVSMKVYLSVTEFIIEWEANSPVELPTESLSLLELPVALFRQTSQIIYRRLFNTFTLVLQFFQTYLLHSLHFFFSFKTNEQR
jgi:hypothetical protein